MSFFWDTQFIDCSCMQIAYIILFTFSGAFWSNSIVDRETFTTSNHGSDIFVLISHCSQPNTDKMTFVQVQELGISKLCIQ